MHPIDQTSDDGPAATAAGRAGPATPSDAAPNRRSVTPRLQSASDRQADDDIPAYRELQARLQKPIFNRVLDREVGRGDTDYEVYLQTAQLLSAQRPAQELAHHDEMLFQIVHQTQELWLKLVAHEAVALLRQLDADELWPACITLQRMVRTMTSLEQGIQVLDTLSPADFQIIRRYLGKGSGLQSPGHNQLRLAAQYIDSALARLLSRHQITLVQVYQDQNAADIRCLCELLLDLDATHQRWLTSHFLLVRRTIGVGRTVRALDGFPTKALAGRMTQPLFQALWEVRVAMTAAWEQTGGVAPGQPRPAGHNAEESAS